MGFFDLPTPVFQWVDGFLMLGIPVIGRVVIWALAASVVSMWLYKRMSSQSRIDALSKQATAARLAQLRYDGEFSGMLLLARDALTPAFLQLGLVLGPALLASFPSVCLMVWMSTAYGYDLPGPGEEIEVSVSPAAVTVVFRPSARLTGTEGVWLLRWPKSEETAVLLDAGGNRVFSLPLDIAVPRIHKKRWWNVLIANPAGYLPDEAAFDMVSLGIPKQEMVSIGPRWIRAWEMTFFTVLTLASLTIKVLFKIH